MSEVRKLRSNQGDSQAARVLMAAMNISIGCTLFTPAEFTATVATAVGKYAADKYPPEMFDAYVEVVCNSIREEMTRRRLEMLS